MQTRDPPNVASQLASEVYIDKLVIQPMKENKLSQRFNIQTEIQTEGL